MAYTSALGLTMNGSAGMTSHLLTGLFTAMLTCGIHVLVMFYLIGTGKDVRDAVEEHAELRAKFVPLTRQLKRRAFPAATLAIVAVIVATLMGGEVHSRIIRPEGELPFRGVTAWWVHLLFVLVAVGSSVYAFYVELCVVKDNRRSIDEINRVLE